MRTKALFGAVGAALMYFFDPEAGNRRRSMAGDRVAAAFRQLGRRLGRAARGVSAEASGVSHRMVHFREQEKDLDDVTLARKVETEIFRDPEVPKGDINVNAVDGVVYLRGEIERPELIRDLEEATRKVTGVKAVENLLHTPEKGTSPRSKS